MPPLLLAALDELLGQGQLRGQRRDSDEHGLCKKRKTVFLGH
jgi:hypothetical protein